MESLSSDYLALKQALLAHLESKQVMTSATETLAHGTDASFYRLIPKIVIKVNDLSQLELVMAECSQRGIAYTYRAAGTSLSGQALSDSVLILLSDDWRGHQILEQGEKISLQPGVIGADANRYLAPFQRKIGPDPASINSCKIGGIVANNASGMCCGTAHNTYHTLSSMTLVLSDGTELNTADETSVAKFRDSKAEFLQQLDALAEQTKNDSKLSELIKHKYRLKNTTGYSLNALVDFSDPIEILQHLMVGSEGTLGFIAEVTYNTVHEHPHKASGLLVFADSDQACRAVQAISELDVAAVELMDGRALASVADKPGLPEFVASLNLQACALLVELHGHCGGGINKKVEAVNKALSSFELLAEISFTEDKPTCEMLWGIRKGMFPAVGAVRQVGTTVIIEDVAFPIEDLAKGVTELQALFDKYHYHEAIIFGHALAGNLHFVFTQSFDSEQEVSRYDAFMHEVSELVAVKYQGSLKAEHGTGRNMAPFIELEWGKQGLQLMEQLKALFDPKGLLNPGVIVNPDPKAHIKNLKPMPQADDLVDRCIECGFCEAVCPSRSLTLSPRQRIVMYREISELRRQPEQQQRLQDLEQDFKYQGIDTCAAVGLCADRCPVGINTGDLIRQLRAEALSPKAQRIASWTADHFATSTAATGIGLASVNITSKILGKNLTQRLARGLNKLSGQRSPEWHPYLPGKASTVKLTRKYHANKVVYFPSCAARTMGPASVDEDKRSLLEVTQSVVEKAGYELIVPDQMAELCCGMPFQSKGYFEQSAKKASQLEEELWRLSEQGRWPILMDTSPCAKRSIEQFSKPLQLFEPIGFVHDHLLCHLSIAQLDEEIMVHLTCSSRRMGLEGKLMSLARACAKQVVLPEHIQCCGWAGDKGFTTPELNAAALKPLAEQIPKGCTRGYSNSRTCEIGLSLHSGLNYRSILHLVDEVST